MEALSKRRVQQGAQMLDVMRPGWAATIDPKILDINNSRVCILGQMFGHYLIGCTRLGLRFLDLEYGLYPEAYEGAGPELTRLWIEEINQRVAAPLLH